MTIYRVVVFLLLAVLASHAAAQSRPAKGKAPTGKIYCWDTEQGRRCGDTLPPEAAGARRDELSTRTGNVLNQVDRTKTPEELEAERLAQEQAQAAKNEIERLERDRGTLRLRYSSVAAIKNEYATRRQALEVGLGLAETSEKSSHRSLVAALDDLAGLEISGKKVTDNAFKRVSDLHKEWSRQREGVQGARARLVELDTERDRQIELWSQPDAPAIAPAPEPTPTIP